jgi:cell division transport system permease protein
MKKVRKTSIKKDIRQARYSGGNDTDKLQAYLRIHAHALLSSLGRLLRAPITTLLTITVLAIAITLASGFYLLVVNVQQMVGNLESNNQISLYLKLNTSDKKSRALANRLAADEDIEQVKLITKQQALEEFKEYSGFGAALDALQKNPLPTVIQVQPKDVLPGQLDIKPLFDRLKLLPDVDIAQIDMQWVKRLQSILELVRLGVILLSGILGLAVLFITGNTIRLELHNRRDEVMIAKLVGATHAFIRRPFLYSGFWYGFFAGLLAWFIILLLMLIIQQPIERLSALYTGQFDLLYLNLIETLVLLFISSVLGVIGARIVLGFQLRQLQPQ